VAAGGAVGALLAGGASGVADPVGALGGRCGDHSERHAASVMSTKRSASLKITDE
jgi:hypothetical protein